VPDTFLLPRLLSRESQVDAILNRIMTLPAERGYRVEIHEQSARRSEAQNNYLWGVVYPAICRHLEGWESGDVHEYCLGEHFGWETVEGFGRKRIRPIRRSSRLSKMEFVDYIGFIQRSMAERGIIIPDPDPEWFLREAAA
jgi:hypothetical protein